MERNGWVSVLISDREQNTRSLCDTKYGLPNGLFYQLLNDSGSVWLQILLLFLMMSNNGQTGSSKKIPFVTSVSGKLLSQGDRSSYLVF